MVMVPERPVKAGGVHPAGAAPIVSTNGWPAPVILSHLLTFLPSERHVFDSQFAQKEKRQFVEKKKPSK